jgi:cytidylate kinase
MSREAMQIALEALEKVITAFGSGLTLQQKAATALRQALETDKQWVGLTDEEAKKTFEEHNCVISADLAGILARAIEAKLKEKNT